ncbi:MAG: 8-oxoguanine deaminase [Candidatus Dormibacteraeota bacterium]|nr:8-oxoguanine deaminase [Candidatus Dormibacteraeota bacterium]
MILVESCSRIATMDDAGTEFSDGSILIDGGLITWIGTGKPPASGQVRRIDGRGLVAIPGLVNTHHHLYQVLTRVRAQQQGLFGWLKELYPVWAHVDQEWERTAALIGLSELALSGCTTSVDHHYVFPRGVDGLIEAEIDAAKTIGLRFHPCRGSMDLGESKGGLPPDSIVQDIDTVLSDTEAIIRRHHDPAPGSMLQIAVGPCSPFSVSDRLMRESVTLARKHQVRLHTHIAETIDEQEFCREKFGRRPIQLLEDLGFLGDDVWLAHCVHADEADTALLAKTRTGVAWCPSSNARLGSGIAPARRFLDSNVRLGLSVDGSASNDGNQMLAEARQGMLMTRAVAGPASMTAREVLRIATRGGAACLGRDDIGSLGAGKRADIAFYPVDGPGFVGAETDPIAALVFCAPSTARHLFVEGRQVVADGRLTGVDVSDLRRPVTVAR